MTTPESRRVKTDRKASFVDDIGQRTQELEREERETQLKRQREGGRGRKMPKTRKTPATDKKVLFREMNYTSQGNFFEFHFSWLQRSLKVSSTGSCKSSGGEGVNGRKGGGGGEGEWLAEGGGCG